MRRFNSKDGVSSPLSNPDMRAKLRGLKEQSGNIQYSLELATLAHNGITEMTGILERGMELIVLTSDEYLPEEDKVTIQQELVDLTDRYNSVIKDMYMTDEKIVKNAPVRGLLDVEKYNSIQEAFSLFSNNGASLSLDNVDILTDLKGSMEVFSSALKEVSKEQLRISALQSRLTEQLDNSLEITDKFITRINWLSDNNKTDQVMSGVKHFFLTHEREH